MKESRYFRVSLLCQPILPAREVAVAYLSDCGFDMFEEADNCLVAYAKDNDLDDEEYRRSLAELREIAEVTVEE